MRHIHTLLALGLLLASTATAQTTPFDIPSLTVSDVMISGAPSGSIPYVNAGGRLQFSQALTTDATGNLSAAVISASTNTARTFTYPTRALNTCFQISPNRDASVTYSVNVGAPLSLTAGATGTVFLRVYTDSSCTTGEQTVTQGSNSLTGTLVVGLSLNAGVTVDLRGTIKAGMYAKLVTENTTGNPTFAIRNPSQEVML